MINLSTVVLLFSVSHTGLPLSSACLLSRSISSHPLLDSLYLLVYLFHLHSLFPPYVPITIIISCHWRVSTPAFSCTCTVHAHDRKQGFEQVSCSLCLRARPLFLHGVSLNLSLSKNENSAETQPHVFLYNRLQYHSIASGGCKASCQEDSFLWVYYISGRELYSEAVDFSKQSALHCFRAHSCHVLCDRLIFTPTQRKISHTVAYRVHSVPLVLLYSLQIADGNYCRLVLEN